MKLNNKGYVHYLFLYGLMALVATVHYTKYTTGEWGKNGTDTLEARQAKIVADGGHINTSSATRQTFDYYVQP